MAAGKITTTLPTLLDADGKPVFHVLRPSKMRRDLNLVLDGTPQFTNMMKVLDKCRKTNQVEKLPHPVIFVLDNDDGLKAIRDSSYTNGPGKIDVSTTSPFYRILDDVYIVKIPEGSSPTSKSIESLYPPAWQGYALDGKTPSFENKFDKDKQYSKTVFADRVVAKNWNSIDFAEFLPLFERISRCISDFCSP